MAVRSNKPAFNIREKLKELTTKFGLKGTELARAETVQDARDLVSAGRKNMIINGAMTINQRNGTSSYVIPNATGGSYGGPDRWAVNEATGATISVNMDGDPSSSNALNSDVREFSKAFQFAVTADNSSLSSTENLHFFQNVEGYNTAKLAWGTEKAKPVTLSFWVKCNVPGIYCVGLENNAVNRTCIREYTVDPGYKWQKVVLTFPGPTDGTWERTNSIGIRIRFCLASGTQYDDGIDGQWVNSDELTTGNQVNFVSSTNNRYFITGVQLEEGNNATEFEHRFYNDELALCERYYYQIGSSSGGSSGSRVLGPAYTPSTNEVAMAVFHPTTMRVKPACTIVNTNANDNLSALRFRYTGNNNFTLSSSGTILNSYLTPQGGSVWFQGLSHGVSSSGEVRTNEANGSGEFTFLRFDAEL